MLPIGRYQFTFYTLDPLHLPPFPGSALRGVFGHSLRQSVCVTRLKDCRQCALNTQCAYTLLFESDIHSGKSGNTPQPMVIDCHRVQQDYPVGAYFSICVTLIGGAVAHLPYVIQAWRRAGARGLGRDRARFSLAAVHRLDLSNCRWDEVLQEPDMPAVAQPMTESVPGIGENRSAGVHLLTPYRSKLEGRLVTPDNFSGRGFLSGLVRRVASLQSYYDPTATPIDTRSHIEAVAEVEASSPKLHWREWTRQSSRQGTRMQMGGVTGQFQLHGEGLVKLWPILEVGQWLQAGKNTLFGLGRYKLTTLEEQ